MTSDIGAILDVKKRFEHIWCITPKSKRDQNLDTISKFGRRELISLDKKKIGGGGLQLGSHFTSPVGHLM